MLDKKVLLPSRDLILHLSHYNPIREECKEEDPVGSRSEKVDVYIQDAAEFARPILRSIRETVHQACPEAEEAIKWGFPHFTYKGILCSMAAFSEHCALTFWKGEDVLGKGVAREGAMGQFGPIRSPADLPEPSLLREYLERAKALNDAGTPGPTSRKRSKVPEPTVPEDLRGALDENKKARETFEGFPPGQRREYVDWIMEARRPETRARRLATAVEWLAEGKRRNWKYEK